MAVPLSPEVLVFDMDGVLVDVTESYRAAIQATVHHFTGEDVSNDLIQEYKNSGGWNNDWLLSERLIHERLAAQGQVANRVSYPEVVEYFNQVFLGPPGLIYRERWLPREDLFPLLESRHRLAIFTGRTRPEAEITLERFAAEVRFDPVITDELVHKPKPAPDGLLAIAKHYGGQRLLYVGDTVDDALSARAAGVDFIGVAAAGSPRREELDGRLRGLGALAIISEINELAGLLADDRQ